MIQRLGSETAHVASVPCAASESDAACSQRAERQVAATLTDDAEVQSAIYVEPDQLRVELNVDGATSTLTFDSYEALAEHVTDLREDGHSAVVTGAEPVRSANAERKAIVRALGPAKHTKEETLRLHITLAAPAKPVAAMVLLTQRAARAALSLRTVSGRPDHDIEVELTCTRPPN